MIVVIDTNVLISGLVSQGPPSQVINLWITNKIIVCVSSEIVEEYLTVVLRPKFRPLGTAQERYDIISKLIELDNTKMVCPSVKLNAVQEDPDDNIFLECALQSNANVIITGDQHLLGINGFKGIEILQPQYFLKHLF